MRDLLNITLHLADNALILAQRNAEWSGHGPALEEDIALSNQSLDLLGQARLLYQLAAKIENKDEDHYAYWREAAEFKNFTLCELPHSAPSVGYAHGARDYAITITRNFLFSSYMLSLWSALEKSDEQALAEIAAKSIKEVRYHLRHSQDWLVRLGDGTEDSHARMQAATDYLLPFSYEFDSWIQTHADALELDAKALVLDYRTRIDAGLKLATLTLPKASSSYAAAGASGLHSEHLSFLLAEMQSVARAHPGAAW
jgi:ring-1,2-phenylacetyl-CoA epoxidase subunit PaaC